MIEFQENYSTPLAQRQSELEQVIKFYEIQRADSISGLFYGVSVGFGFLFLMGFLVGYDRFAGGYLLLGIFSSLTLTFVLLRRFIVPWVETRNANLKKKYGDWLK